MTYIKPIFLNLFKTILPFVQHRMWLWYLWGRGSVALGWLSAHIAYSHWTRVYPEPCCSLGDISFLLLSSSPKFPSQPPLFRSLNSDISWHFLQNIRIKSAQQCCDIPFSSCALFYNILHSAGTIPNAHKTSSDWCEKAEPMASICFYFQKFLARV